MKQIPYNSSESFQIYRKEISKYPLLDREKERKLALEVKEGNLESRTKLINSNLRLVVFRAKKFLPSGLPILDLINEGNSGLIKAVDRYDPEKYKTRLTTYAVWWIEQSILKGIPEMVEIIRFPRSFYKKKKYFDEMTDYKPGLNKKDKETIYKELHLTKESAFLLSLFSEKIGSLNSPIFEDLEVLDTIPDPENCIDQIETELMSKQIYGCLSNSLDSREVEIIKYRFGLDNLIPLTLEQIGQKFKITKERVRQIQEKALLKLGHFYRDLKDE